MVAPLRSTLPGTAHADRPDGKIDPEGAQANAETG